MRKIKLILVWCLFISIILSTAPEISAEADVKSFADNHVTSLTTESMRDRFLEEANKCVNWRLGNFQQDSTNIYNAQTLKRINDSWCAWFVTYCAFKAGLTSSYGSQDNLFPPCDTANDPSEQWSSTNQVSMANWLKKNAKAVPIARGSELQPGDILIVQGYGHIVIYAGNGYTIGGNEGYSSGASNYSNSWVQKNNWYGNWGRIDEALRPTWHTHIFENGLCISVDCDAWDMSSVTNKSLTKYKSCKVSNAAGSAKVRTGPYEKCKGTVEANGKELIIVEEVTNLYGHLWYKLDDGRYIYSKNVTGIKDVPSKITISMPTENYTINQGNSCEISGSITSTYNVTAKGYLDGADNPYAFVTGTKYVNLADATGQGFNSFKGAALSPGNHYIVIEVEDTNHIMRYAGINIFVKSVSIPVGSPTISQPTDIEGGKEVKIIQNTSGATLTYEINGEKHTTNESAVKLSFTQPGVYTINAYSSKDGKVSTQERKEIEVGVTNMPEIGYTLSATGAVVEISSSETEVNIFYSTNGRDFIQYVGPFSLESNTRVYAKTTKLGFVESDVSEQEVLMSAPEAPVIYMQNKSSDIAVGDSAVINWDDDSLTSSYVVSVYKDSELVHQSEPQTTAQYVYILDDEANYTFKVTASNPFGSTVSRNSIKFTAHGLQTVLFKDYDGTVLVEQKVKYGYDAERPQSSPSRKGYTFSGWNTSFYNVRKNIDVIATYQINTYRINYYDVNNNYLTSETVVYGKSINSSYAEQYLPMNKVGYEFKGWYVLNASDDSDRNINFVDSDMSLIAVSGWEDEEYKVVVTNLNARRHFDSSLGVATGYDVQFDISSIPGADTKAKIVATALSEDNQMLATSVLVISSDADMQESSKEMFISYDSNILADKIEINVFAVEKNDRTGGLIAESVSCSPIPDDNDSVWSDWVEALPEGVNTATQTKTVYRSRQNTRSTVTSTSENVPAGYTLLSSESYWDEDWNGPFDYVIDESDTKLVKTENVVASYKTQYQYYRFTCNSNWAHGWYGFGCACASYMRLGGSCGGRIINSPDYIWSDVPYSAAYGWANATSDGVAKFNSLGTGSLWYFNTTGWNQATRTVPDSYKDQYYYKELHNLYTFYKWELGNWSDWGDEILTANADGSFDVETKTLYRYVTSSIGSSGEGQVFTVEYDNSLVNADSSVPAAILVYKSQNSDPTESQLEYVKNVSVGELNGYRFKAKEDPTISSGDFVVAVSVKGYDGLINVGMIEAPKPQYTVVFQMEDGTVISEQVVSEGASAEVPEIPEKEGFVFAGWNKSTAAISYNVTIMPTYIAIPYAVAYVDYLNRTCELMTVSGGSTLTVPEKVPSCEGYTFAGWKGAEEGTIVTGNTVVTAEWIPNEYTVKFYDADSNVISTQKVKYGESAVLPNNVNKKNMVFLGWNSDVEWWNVKSDLDVYPSMIYSLNTLKPESNVGTNYMADQVSVELTCADDATIYYTLDGSKPDVFYYEHASVDDAEIENVTYVYNGAIELADTTFVRAIAIEPGKNASEELYVSFVCPERTESSISSELVEINTYNVYAEPGQSVSLSLDITDNPGLLGYLFTVECDRQNFYIERDAEGEYLFETGEAFDMGTTMVTEYEDRGWYIFWYSAEPASQDGKAFTVTLKLSDETAAGYYPIRICYSPSNTVSQGDYKMDEHNVSPAITTSTGSLLGDVNGDGQITAVDVLRVAKSILGLTKFTDEQKQAADVNRDGKITNADVIRLARYLIGAAELG